MSDKNITALDRAINLAGGQTALGNLINRSQGHVSNWIKRGKKVPPLEARLIDEALDGQVTRYELRPDVFGEAAA